MTTATWYDETPSIGVGNVDDDGHHGLWIRESTSNGDIVQDSLNGDVVINTGDSSQTLRVTSSSNNPLTAITITDDRVTFSRPVTLSNQLNALTSIVDTVDDDLCILGTRITASNMALAGLRLASSYCNATAPLIPNSNSEPWPGEIRAAGFVRLVAGGDVDETPAAFIDVASSTSCNNTITMGTSGVERMRVTANGYVGIIGSDVQINDPTALLTVEGGALHVQRESHDDPEPALLTIRHDRSVAGLSLSHAPSGEASVNASEGSMSISASNAITFCNANASFVAVFDAEGRFGVGAPTPEYRIDVSGDVRASATVIGANSAIGKAGTVGSWAGFWHSNDTSRYPVLVHDDDGGVTQVGCTRGGGISFADDNYPWAVFSGGRLGVGTISPQHALDVYGSAAIRGATLTVGLPESACNVFEQGVDVVGSVRASRALYVGRQDSVVERARSVIGLNNQDFDLVDHINGNTPGFIVIAHIFPGTLDTGTIIIRGDVGGFVADEPQKNTASVEITLTIGSTDVIYNVSKVCGGHPTTVSQHSDIVLCKNPDTGDYLIGLEVRVNSVFALDVFCSGEGYVPVEPTVSDIGIPLAYQRVKSILDDPQHLQWTTWSGETTFGPWESNAVPPTSRFAIAHETLGARFSILAESSKLTFAAQSNDLTSYSILGAGPNRDYMSIGQSSSSNDGMIFRQVESQWDEETISTCVGVNTVSPTQTLDVRGVAKAGHLLHAGDAVSLGCNALPALIAEPGCYVGHNLEAGSGAAYIINNGAWDISPRGWKFLDYADGMLTSSNPVVDIHADGTIVAAGAISSHDGMISAVARGGSSDSSSLELSNANGRWAVSLGGDSSNVKALTVSWACNDVVPKHVAAFLPSGRMCMNAVIEESESLTSDGTLVAMPFAGNSDMTACFVAQDGIATSRLLTITQSSEPGGAVIEARGVQDLTLNANGDEGIRVSRVSGFVGVGGQTSPMAPLAFRDVYETRKISLFDEGRTDEFDARFDGFGVSEDALMYTTRNGDTDHVFLSARTSSSAQELVRFTGSGRVGINCSSNITIDSTLHVQGDAHVSQSLGIASSNASAALSVRSTENTHQYTAMLSSSGASDAVLHFETASAGASPYISMTAGDASESWSIGTVSSNSKFVIGMGSNALDASLYPHAIVLDSMTGSLGVGVHEPIASLDVYGDIACTDGLRAASTAFIGDEIATLAPAAVFGHVQSLDATDPLDATWAVRQDATNKSTTLCGPSNIYFGTSARCNVAVLNDMGNLALGGDLMPSRKLEVHGSAYVSGDLEVDEDARVHGDLYVDGQIFNSGGSGNGGTGGNGIIIVGNTLCNAELLNAAVRTDSILVRNPFAVANDPMPNSNAGLYIEAAWRAQTISTNPLVSSNDTFMWFKGDGLSICPEFAGASGGLRMDAVGNVRIGSRFVVMGGEDAEQSVQPRGIFMWNSNDSRFGMYAASPGAGRALGGGIAPSGVSFGSNAVRIRMPAGSNHGLIIESSDNTTAASCRGDGVFYIRSNVGLGVSPQEKLHVRDGSIRMSGGSFKFADTQDSMVPVEMLLSNDDTLVVRGATASEDGTLAISPSLGTVSVNVSSMSSNAVATLTVRPPTRAFMSNVAVTTSVFADGGAILATSSIGAGFCNAADVLSARLVLRETATSTAVARFVNPTSNVQFAHWIGFASGMQQNGDASDGARIGMQADSNGAGSLFMTTGARGAQQKTLTIDATGNVGIATEQPLTKLHVQGGDIALLATAPERGQRIVMDWVSSNTFAGWQRRTDAIVHSVATSNENHVFVAGNVEIARLTGIGHLGLGLSNPIDTIHVGSGGVLAAGTRAFTNVLVHRTDQVSGDTAWNHFTLDAAALDAPSNASQLAARDLFDYVRATGLVVIDLGDGSLAHLMYDADRDYYVTVNTAYRSLQVRRIKHSSSQNVLNTSSTTFDVIVTVRTLGYVGGRVVSVHSSWSSGKWSFAQGLSSNPTTLGIDDDLFLSYASPGLSDAAASTQGAALGLSPNGQVRLGGVRAASSAIGFVDLDDIRYARGSKPQPQLHTPALFVTRCNDSDDATLAEFCAQDLSIGVGISPNGIKAVGNSAHQPLVISAAGACNVVVYGSELEVIKSSNARVALKVCNPAHHDQSTASIALSTTSTTSSEQEAVLSLSSASNLASPNTLLLQNPVGIIRIQASSNSSGLTITSNAVSIHTPIASYASLSVLNSVALVSDVSSVSEATPHARTYIGDNAHGIGMGRMYNSNQSSLYMFASSASNANTEIVLGHCVSSLGSATSGTPSNNNSIPSRSLVVAPSGNTGFSVPAATSLVANVHIARDVFMQAVNPVQLSSNQPLGMSMGFESNASTRQGFIISAERQTGSNADLLMRGRSIILATSAVGVSEAVRITSNGNMGIGTSNPTFKLHVSGGDVGITTSSQAALRLGSNVSMIADSGTAIAGRFMMSNTGHVGIMTSAPSAYLQVTVPDTTGADPRSNGVAIVNLTASNNAHAIASIRTAAGAMGGDPFVSMEIVGTQGWSAGVHRADGAKFKLSASSNGFASGEVVTVTPTGSVGIGTATPLQRVHISNGSMLVSGGGGCIVNATSAATLLYSICNASTGAMGGLGTGDAVQDLRFSTPASGSKQQFFVNSVREMEVTSSGLFVRSNVTCSNLSCASNAIIAGQLRVGSGTPSLISTGIIGSNTSAYLSASNVPFMTLDATGSNGAHAPTSMCITATGQVGIGTSNPSARLHVDGSMLLGGGASLMFAGTSGDSSTPFHTFIAENLYSGTQASELVLAKLNEADGVSGPDRIRHIAAQHVFQVYNSNQVPPVSVASALSASYTTAATINSNGFVGIGTVSPAYALDVVGALNWRSGDLRSNGVILPVHNVYSFYNTSSNIYNNHSWNVGINTSNPTHNLDVRGSVNLSNVLFQDGTTAAFTFANTGFSPCNMLIRGAVAIGAGVGSGTFTPDAAASLHLTSGSIVMNAFHASNTTASSNPNQWIEMRRSNALQRFAVSASIPGGATSNNRLFFNYNETGSSPTESNSLVTLRADGNLGVGASNPTARLHVAGRTQLYGRVILNDGTDNGFAASSNINNGLQLWTDGTFGIYRTTVGAARSFEGGTTTAYGGVTGASLRLRVNGAAAGPGLVVEDSAERNLFAIQAVTGHATLLGAFSNSGGCSTSLLACSGASALANVTCSNVTISGSASVSSNLILASATSRVGVGVSTPAAPLHVSGEVLLYGKVSISDGTDGGSNHGLQMWNTTDVGIYTASPGANKALNGTGTAASASGVSGLALRLRTSNSATGGFIFENSSDVALVGVAGATGSMWVRGNMSNVGSTETTTLTARRVTIGTAVLSNINTSNDIGICAGAVSQSIFLRPNGATSVTGQTTFSTTATSIQDGSLVINNASNVGIGIATPVQRLHVNGNTSLVGGRLTVNDGTDGGTRGIMLWTSNDNDWGIYVSTPGAGKSFNAGAAGFNANVTSHALRFRTANASGNGFVFENSGEQVLMALNSSTGNMYVNGDITVLSDARYKNNVQRVEGALDRVCRLSGYTYNSSSSEGGSGEENVRRHVGLLAQEVQREVPEAVYESPPTPQQTALGEPGKMSVAYGNLIGVLVEAIKELRSELDALRGRINPP